jgi:hypothetical protein
MGVLHRAAVVVSIIFSAGLSLAQKLPEWLPIAPQDLQIKAVPNRPGDAAIQLYFSYYKDDDANFISVYRRIKVLNDAGKRFADVEILLDRDESLKDFKARTIRPDGSLVEFHGKAFEKTIVKARGIKYAARTFTMPEVTAGSIVEYAYLITLPRGVVSTVTEWPVQSDLFTLQEDLHFRPFQGVVMTSLEWTSAMPQSRVAYAYLNQIDTRVPQKKEGNLMELHLDNVAPFDGEEYMPPAADYRPTILFYYGGRETATPEKFWADWQKLLIEYGEKFIGNSREIHDAAAQAIGSETDPEQKLRKLYARAQQIRNLSYERERTQEEKKKERIKDNPTAKDVLQRGYGTSRQIDAVFTALARAAGFDATLVAVSDRRERSFNKMVLSFRQLDGSAVLVNVNGKEMYLDPGTKFCPYGLLRWNHTSTATLRYSKGGSGSDFILTPVPEGSPMRRIANVALSADGSIKGELTVELRSQDALEHRLDALETDEAGRRKNFEDEVKAWLPSGSVVKMIDSSGWETAEGPVLARFSIEVPNYGSVAGKRLVAPAFLFSTLQKGVFTHDTRRFPIAFPYSFVESDEITMKLPQGYSLEQPPYRRKAGLQAVAYEISSTLNEKEDELITKRSLRLNSATFPPEQYPELKNFFNVVLAGDGGQAVLRTGTAEADGKKE